MANHTTESRNKAQEAAGKAQDAARTAVEAGQSAAAGVADKARDLSSDAMRAGQQAAHQAAQAVGSAAENATSRVGEGMQTLAQTVRQRVPDSGVLGSAADTVASTLEQGGRYIQSEGLSGMSDDLSAMIRKNPIPALLVGVGVGFLLARLTSRS